jgi:hypothetical protein
LGFELYLFFSAFSFSGLLPNTKIEYALSGIDRVPPKLSSAFVALPARP